MIRDGGLFRQGLESLREALRKETLVYHEGSIGGAFPRIVPAR
jgi:hypothetical protein